MLIATADQELDDIEAKLLETPTATPRTLPLWLTEDETEALILLCATSPRNGGPLERELFGKLGDLIRAFRR